MRLRILDSALEDLDRGRRLYDRQGEGLGTNFLDSLFGEIDSLLLYGGIHRKVFGFHRLLARRFTVVSQSMQTLPFSLALAALASVLSACVSSLTPERRGEVDSPIKAFVQYGLDRRAEAYLVCVYQAERTGGAKNEVEIQATVVDRIKGTRQVGESLSFKRVSDSGAWDLPGMRGKLLYIFLDRDADGRAFVDSQDPQALYKCTDELQTIVAKYRRKG